MIIRPTTAEDIGQLQHVLEETELFPASLLPDMMQDFLSGQSDESLWLTAEVEGKAAGFCFARPEALTNGTWNMLVIAVLPALQGRGMGGHLVRALEAELARRGQRILLADTSGLPAFARTRAFYRRQDYTEVARIPGFWDAGDDKVVFWKALPQG